MVDMTRDFFYIMHVNQKGIIYENERCRNRKLHQQ